MRTNRQSIARRSKRAFRGARLDSSEDSASGRGFLFGDERLVGGGVHQARNLGGSGELSFDQPSGAVRVGVNDFWFVGQLRICFGHFPRHRSENFADRLDGFNGAENFSCGDLLADRWNFDKNNIAEFVLGVIGNSDRAGIAGHLDPLMIFRITIVAWIHHGSLGMRPGPTLARLAMFSRPYSITRNHGGAEKPLRGAGATLSTPPISDACKTAWGRFAPGPDFPGLLLRFPCPALWMLAEHRPCQCFSSKTVRANHW